MAESVGAHTGTNRKFSVELLPTESGSKEQGYKNSVGHTQKVGVPPLSSAKNTICVCQYLVELYLVASRPWTGSILDSVAEVVHGYKLPGLRHRLPYQRNEPTLTYQQSLS